MQSASGTICIFVLLGVNYSILENIDTRNDQDLCR